MLEAAIWGAAAAPGAAPAAGWSRPAPPGPVLLLTATRLGVCTGLAYLAFYLLPVHHGYWIPLTVALVMKPDLGSVFARATLRSFGTVAGAVVAVLVAALAPAGPVAACVVVAVFAAVLPWAIGRSYLWQVLVLTPLVMILIDVVVPHDRVVELGVDRIVATVLGGVIVVVAGYLVWPSARHVHVARSFAATLTALADYAGEVAGGAGPDAVAATRRDVYRRLSDTRAALQRTLAEPPPAGAEAWSWIPVVAAAERVADRITGASATRSAAPDVPASAELRALAADLRDPGAARRRTAGAERIPVASVHGADSPDPAIRELADEIAHLRSMLVPDPGSRRLGSSVDAPRHEGEPS